VKFNPPRLHFVASAVFAASVAAGFYYLAEANTPEKKGEQEWVSVVVAKKFLKPGERIQKNNLEELKIPKPYVQPLAFLSKDECTGGIGVPYYVPRIGLLKGEQITRSKVLEESRQTDLEWTLDSPHRGLTLELDKAAAGGGFLRPGVRVSVFGVFDAQPGIPDPRADLIESSVQVLAVNGRTVAFEDVNDEKQLPKKTSNDSFLVTLSLSSRQIARVLLGQSRGRVVLTVQPGGEEAFEKVSGATLSALRSREGP
jgi:Flp pilus assembly protein CpaB